MEIKLPTSADLPPKTQSSQQPDAFKEEMIQKASPTGFFTKVGLASGVREGIQKLGRFWLDVAAEPAVDGSPELLCEGPGSLSLLWPEGIVYKT